MPQFDTFSFFSQVSWLFLVFITFFLFNSYFFLPAWSIILKVRKIKAHTASLNSSNFLIFDFDFSTYTNSSILNKKTTLCGNLNPLLIKTTFWCFYRRAKASIVINAFV